MKKFTKVALIAQFIPFVAMAQTLPQSGVTDFPGIISLICRLAGYAFTILVVLSIVFVIYAAYLYLTAAGDPEKVKKANATILYAAIAIVVAILAKALPGIVGSLMNTPGIEGRALGC